MRRVKNLLDVDVGELQDYSKLQELNSGNRSWMWFAEFWAGDFATP